MTRGRDEHEAGDEVRVIERKAERDSGAERVRDDERWPARLLQYFGSDARLRCERLRVAACARGMAEAGAVVGDDAMERREFRFERLPVGGTQVTVVW